MHVLLRKLQVFYHMDNVIISNDCRNVGKFFPCHVMGNPFSNLHYPCWLMGDVILLEVYFCVVHQLLEIELNTGMHKMYVDLFYIYLVDIEDIFALLDVFFSEATIYGFSMTGS